MSGILNKKNIKLYLLKHKENGRMPFANVIKFFFEAGIL
jgi:hypothetical protein